MDFGSFAIGVLAGGLLFGVSGMLIGIALGAMSIKIEAGKRLRPRRDGSVKFN